MPKRLFLSCFIFILAIASTVFYFAKHKKIISFDNNQTKNIHEDLKKEEPVKATPSEKTFDKQFLYVSGWLPYWKKQAGVDSLAGNLASFSEINPFAFGVNADGSLRDTLGIKNTPWPELITSARKENTAIVPTILWADAPAMHAIFSDSQKLEKHIEAISEMLSQNNFPGVDIDYEGKDISDKALFSNFLEALQKKLKPAEKTIACTVEARTQDNPPDGWTGTRAMSFANDYRALDQFCDSVRIMAYDQVFQVNGGQKIFDDSSEIPIAPNADVHWVEKVMRYALQTIPPEKLVMGVPTYGWEFAITKTNAGYHYARVKSVTYPQALEEQTKSNATLWRTAGGELFFSYDASDGKHLVTFSDSESAKQKIELAKNLGLKGISLFKIDGQTDPKLFSLIKAETMK